MKKHIVIGLTGLIGSGKSLVSSLFAKLGAHIIDTDVIAYQLTNSNGAALPIIAEKFGKEYINISGVLDRAKMRRLVFDDANLRIELESILHPLIYDKVIDDIDNYVAECIIVVVPLLFKARCYIDLIDYTLFVDSNETNLIKRVELRNGLDAAITRKILLTQVSREEQLNLADYVINNNGSIKELEIQVVALYNEYINILKNKKE